MMRMSGVRTAGEEGVRSDSKLWPEKRSENVTELKGALSRDETWPLEGRLICFQQVEETGHSYPKLLLSKGRLGPLLMDPIWLITG